LKTSKIRIIGGFLKGSHISFPASSKLRPTSNKLREVLFNWLNFEIADLKCADCFSGSGALGIEAISRGAESVLFIEKTPKFASSIETNLKRLKIYEKSNVKIRNAFEWLKEENLENFDLIFFDPPFFDERIKNLLTFLKNQKLKKGTLIYFEKSTFDKIEVPDTFTLLKSKVVGDAEGLLLEK
tara:strand:- start:1817 stop:2368 length:552 start_codon:yes stop_codon:yes gene_type:complete